MAIRLCLGTKLTPSVVDNAGRVRYVVKASSDGKYRLVIIDLEAESVVVVGH
jgi:hypothetical protein